MNDISTALKQFRRNHKITQKQAALAACITERVYQSYEYGKVIPSATTLIALAEYYSVSIDYLVGRTDNPEVNK